MSNIVAFPGLGLEFTINPIAFSIGSFHIYWYGIIATLGIGLGIAYCYKLAGNFNLDEDSLTDIMLFGIVTGIIGARIYYVAFSWDYYKNKIS